jgi:DNA-binding transcriptional ArsR family regulator
MSEPAPDTPEIRKFAALSHPTRLVVFRAVMRAGPDGETAGALARTAGVSPSNLSAHLTILTDAGLITVRAEGRKRIFAPQLEAVADLVRYLIDDCCEGHPEVCAALPDRRSLQRG